MARYIDADKIHEFVDAKVAEGKDGWAKGVPYEWAYALTVIDRQPTADVVPKSEVEDWKEIAETYQKMFEDSYSKYEARLNELNSKLAKCQLDLHYSRKEVAREIFEEIEKIINDYLSFITKIGEPNLGQRFAELKKKYTEGENGA